MKRIFTVIALTGLAVSASAQTKPKIDFPQYKFTTELENPITSIKDQSRSGTCWAYSTISFVESEVIRINGITDKEKYPDFSEFFVVSHSYADRAEKYVRLDGNLTFGAGSEADDVLHVIADYGLVPQQEMTGMNYGTEKPVQGELDAVLKGYVEAVAKNPNKTLTTAWQKGFQGILDAYLGEYPKTFTVDGTEYTPESYRDALGFKPEEYVTISSFTHHPLYTSSQLEVCENWRWDSVYNVPVDEFMEILDNALKNGYTAAWGADVSEAGFTRNGLAILVDVAATNNSGSDQERWVGKADEKKSATSNKKSKKEVNKVVEKAVSQESRQEWFDNTTITDDHGMQIFGIARDQWGNKYYMVKNSWGETGDYKGIWYASEAFVKAQSMDIMIHRSALPEGFTQNHPNVVR